MESICALEMNWKLTVVMNLNEPLRRPWWFNSGENTNKRNHFMLGSKWDRFSTKPKMMTTPPHPTNQPYCQSVKLSYPPPQFSSKLENRYALFGNNSNSPPQHWRTAQRAEQHPTPSLSGQTRSTWVQWSHGSSPWRCWHCHWGCASWMPGNAADIQ